MASDTKKQLRNIVLYSIFVRNYSKEGTFKSVEKDLDRIKDLGVDVIWLMPIHPIGKEKRKGALGSPYAISDYRKINPEYGTLEDFKDLVKAIHERGMKVIIDVVFNHTSPDSVLATTHPEWFYHKADGSLANRVGDWSDIVDLDYSHRELWDEQIETLKYWSYFVDGFRCDVAPLVPVDFWKEARKACGDKLWLAESVEPGFITYMRHLSIPMASDSELYQAFDVLYDYDIARFYQGYLTGNHTLEEYVNAINDQETIYPDNYVKARFLENHDRLRGHFLIPNALDLDNWTAFMYFQKGLVMLYNGQEYGCMHTPTLFDKDEIEPEDLDLTPLLKTLGEIKKDPFFVDTSYHVDVVKDDVVIATHVKNQSQERCVGIFHLKDAKKTVLDVSKYLPDGIYEDLITDKRYEVRQGVLVTDGQPLMFKVER